MKKILYFLAILLAFSSCRKDNDDQYGIYEDLKVDWKFTGLEYQYYDSGREYSVLATTKSKNHFYVIGFEGEEVKTDRMKELCDLYKLVTVLPKGYEDPKPFIFDKSLVWIAFNKDNYKDVAIVDYRGVVKTYYPFKYRTTNFHSEISKNEAYYDRGHYYYSYRLFPED